MERRNVLPISAGVQQQPAEPTLHREDNGPEPGGDFIRSDHSLTRWVRVYILSFWAQNSGRSKMKYLWLDGLLVVVLN